MNNTDTIFFQRSSKRRLNENVEMTLISCFDFQCHNDTNVTFFQCLNSNNDTVKLFYSSNIRLIIMLL